MIFSISYPYWYILLCVLLAAVFTFFLYYRKKNRYKGNIYYLLTAMRFVSLFIVCFLLLSPLLKYASNISEKPVVVFLQDNSASMNYAFKTVDSIKYRNQVEKLMKELKEDYEVKEYSFGNLLTDTLRFSYSESATDVSSALETVFSSLSNNNLGAVILSTDGIYNKGISPLSDTYPFKGSLYTVGIGDTAIKKDALMARVFANKTIYLGDKFAIRSDMAAYSCEGQALTISIFDHSQNRVIATQNVSVSGPRFSKSIETILDANSPGVKHYTISVSKVEGEQNVMNNAQEIYVEVLDSKEKILILANAPHPDIFALQEALSKNKNNKVEVLMAETAKIKVNDYNLIVLHNLPSVLYNLSTVIDQAGKGGISLWYIVGSQTAIPLFNKSQTALQITASGVSGNDAYGVPNMDFSFFTLNQNFISAFSTLPPLYAPFGSFTTGSNAQVLMNQKIGAIATRYPLWVLQPSGNARVGVLAAEGIWRWRLYNYLQHKNHDAVDDFILKSAQYLSVKHDKNQLRSQLQKSVFTEGENITIDAELYNDNFELINIPDVSVTIVNEQNQRNTYTMNKNSNSYTLNLGNMAAGKYSYNCNTVFNGKSFSSGGSFSVVYQNIENHNTTADFGTLNQLSQKYAGEFVFGSDIMQLKEKLKNNKLLKNLIRTETFSEPLINWKWLFILLALLLGTEWYLRKTNGQY